MEVVTLRFRLRRPWCMVDCDLSRFRGKAPQPYADRFERRHKRESEEAHRLRQDNKAVGGWWVTMSGTVLLLVCGSAAMGQDGSVGVVDMPRSGGFMHVVVSGGILGMLNWAGIFFWAAALLPLGTVSVVQCASCDRRQVPLATKLLGIAAAWLFVLGWTGAAQGAIRALSNLATGTPDVGILALNISHALFSVAGALFVCQHYLFFLLISMVVMHFRHRRLQSLPPPTPQSDRPELG